MTSGFGGAIQKRPVVSVVVAFLLGALALGAVWVVAAAALGDDEPETTGPTVAPEESPTAAPPVATDCADVTTTVTDALDLQTALDAATPGDVIALAPATYDGQLRHLGLGHSRSAHHALRIRAEHPRRRGSG